MLLALLQALFNALAMMTLTYFLFTKPMNQDYIMMHEKQLDPTEIVLYPVDRDRLAVGVFVIVLIQVLRFRLSPISLLQSSALLSIAMMVAGAPFTEMIQHTFLGALFCMSLVLGSPAIFAHEEKTLSQRLSGRCSTPQSYVTRCTSQGTIAGTTVLQILRLYDRGWQVQRWPIPTMLGSSLGWCVGCLVGTCWALALGPRFKS